MCDLCGLTTNQRAIRESVAFPHDGLCHLEPLPNVYPNRPALIVRNIYGTCERAAIPQSLKPPKLPEALDTSIIDMCQTRIRQWSQWLGGEHRYPMPAKAFFKHGQASDPVTKRKPLNWFALDQRRPLFFWMRWDETRGPTRAPRPSPHELSAFVTADFRNFVKAIHVNPMPVRLRNREVRKTWLTKDWREASAPRCSLDDDLPERVGKPAFPVG